MPAGDNAIRSLMYTAVGVGCIIVIVCDRLKYSDGAFPDAVPWRDLWVRLPERPFIRDPASALRQLRAMAANRSDVRRRQRLLHEHRRDVLYDVPDSRVGSHFLEAAARSRCFARWNSSREGRANSTRRS